MSDNPSPQVPKVVKRILCLANSRKLSGRCIAGREVVNGLPGSWIRPVSDRQHQEVSSEERRYENGSDPRVLDVIDIALVEARPHIFQQENWLFDPRFYWQRDSRIDWAGLQTFVEAAGPLWLNNSSSYNGLNDRVPLEQANALRSSLRLIRVNGLRIKVFRPGEAFGNQKRRVQGQFEHEGAKYWLWVTDPLFEERFLRLPDGEHQLGESCLCISLGEPHDGYAYKLIAAIIERVENDAR